MRSRARRVNSRRDRARRSRRAATQSKILISRILEQRTAEDGGISVDSIDVHLIGGSPSTLDWQIDCIAAIDQVAGNLNSVLLRGLRPRSAIFQEQIAIADLKSAVVTEDVSPNRDTVQLGRIEV